MKLPAALNRQFDLCAFCPDLCLDRCPVSTVTGSNLHSPCAKMTLGWLLANGRIDPSDDVARAVYHCNGCLACTEACRHKVDVEQALFGLRAALVAQGIAPFPRDLFAEPADALREAQARLVPAAMFVPEAQAVLFAGCSALTVSPGVVSDAIQVFAGLGIEFVGASDDAAACCGYPLWAGGHEAAFREVARSLVERLRRYRMVVALSACCEYTLRTVYAAAGLTVPFRIVHALDLIGPLVTRTHREPLQRRIALSDSCFLGRHLGRYDLPREILTHINGTPPLELRSRREAAPCCGAGGGLDRTDPAASRAESIRVLEMAADAGAAVLATSGPPCTGHLQAAAAEGLPQPVDLLHLVAEWLGGRT
jgi:glycolate oxidase